MKIRRHEVIVDGRKMILAMIRDCSDSYDLMKNKDKERDDN